MEPFNVTEHYEILDRVYSCDYSTDSLNRLVFVTNKQRFFCKERTEILCLI